MRPVFVELLAPAVGERLAAYLVPTGTTLLLAAIGSVLWLMLVRGGRMGLSRRATLGAAVAGVAAGWVGARLLFVMQHLQHGASHPGVTLGLCGGTASWGAYLGGTLGFCAYLRWRRHALSPQLDLLASCLALGPAIARWGCLLSGCCWGRVTGAPWAVRFPAGSHAHAAQARAGLVAADAAASLPVHPVQIYDSLAGVLVFLATSVVWRRWRTSPGRTFAFYCALYGSSRFVTEFWRGDGPRFGAAGFTTAQYIALGLALAGCVLLARSGRSDPALPGTSKRPAAPRRRTRYPRRPC